MRGSNPRMTMERRRFLSDQIAAGLTLCRYVRCQTIRVVIPGRAARREPGIHNPRLWLWIRTSSLRSGSGMTAENASYVVV